MRAMDADTSRLRRPLLVTSSVNRAEEWADTLDAAGVDVLVEVTDAQTGDPASSPLIGVFGTRPPEFVYLVTLPPAQRDLAVNALLDAGWDGREGLRGGRGILSPGETNLRSMAITALCTLAGIGAFVLIWIAAG